MNSSHPATNRLHFGRTVLVASLLFGLFFGAGNLIFPVELGRSAQGATPAATAGFLVTAVGLPMLGIVASALSGSASVLEMTSRVGRRYAVAFTAVLYLTIGPLFAIPRTATVSYEVGLAGSLPAGSRSLWLLGFTLVFFALTGLAALRPGRLIDWVGRYLTPVFLVLLAALLVAAVVRPMGPTSGDAPAAAYARHAATQGFLDGYNTMDALASLAFAVAIIEAVRRMGVTTPGRIAAETARASVLAAAAMALIYGALAYVGATSMRVSRADNGGGVLADVSRHYFGPAGQVLIAAIVLAACLKTAIGLVTSCAEMFSQMWPRALSYRGWVIAFTLVSATIANLGLAAIIRVSLPVLMFLYPLAITAIILGLLTPWLAHRPLVHRVTTAFVAVAACFDLVGAMPAGMPGRAALVGFAGRVLPGYALGFGWVVPALLGLVVGLVLSGRGRGGSAAQGAGSTSAGEV